MPRKKKTVSHRPLLGRVVVDATKDITLRIRKVDVYDASPGDPAKCAVAVACQRLLGADEVLIHRTRAYVRKGEEWTRYEVPDAIQKEIVSFDMGVEFVPGEYTLRAPTPSNQLGTSYHTKKDGGEIKTNRHIRQRIHLKAVRRDMSSGGGMFKELGAEA